jgi:hypothetical protein
MFCLPPGARSGAARDDMAGQADLVRPGGWHSGALTGAQGELRSVNHGCGALPAPEMPYFSDRR